MNHSKAVAANERIPPSSTASSASWSTTASPDTATASWPASRPNSTVYARHLPAALRRRGRRLHIRRRRKSPDGAPRAAALNDLDNIHTEIRTGLAITQGATS